MRKEFISSLQESAKNSGKNKEDVLEYLKKYWKHIQLTFMVKKNVSIMIIEDFNGTLKEAAETY